MSEQAPKTEGLSLETRDAFRKKLFGIVDHINKVNSNVEKLAERIIEKAETEEDLDFARRLIQKARSHDQSKFSGIEFRALNKEEEKELFKIALEQHQQTNDHHPEFWGDIRKMPEIALSEMLADWSSRSQEMGTDLRTYVKEVATKRFGFTTKTNVYKQIKKYMDLLLDDTFT